MSDFTRILIANRGEIALRLARTIAEMGAVPLGVFAPDDEASPHLEGMEASHRLPGEGVRAYLDIQGLIAAAHALGAEAVHPGYGFLSESADFARACEAAGLVFIGPSPETLSSFGDKTRAVALARSAGLAVLPSTGPQEDRGALDAFFVAQQGRAVMIKAVGGGGGRGMRRVETAAELEAGLKLCSAEAKAAFGDPRVYLERAIDRARHVEIQLIGDGRAVLALGLRECSLQRRRQKVIEVAPAIGLSPDLGLRLCDEAEALGRAAGLRGLATVEFLLDKDDDLSPFFIEVNARLQVEHTVTEMTTGLDLVRLQIETARGAELGELGLVERPAARGAAVQLRVTLESLSEDGRFRPASGRLSVFETPGGPGVRVDAAARAGYAPPPGYDSLIAKLIVHAPEGGFAAAVAKARRTASAFRIEGIETSLPLLMALLDRDEVRSGEADTRFIDDHVEVLAKAARHLAPAPVAAAETARPAPARVRREAVPPQPDAEPLLAPLTGTVVSLELAVGEEIAAGQDVVVLEAMKMHHPASCAAPGRLVGLEVRLGETVEEGSVLGWWVPGGAAGAAAVREDHDPDHVRPDLAALQARLALTVDEARPAAMEKRHRNGLRSARENIDDLFDPGSFQEVGALAIAAQRRRRTLEDLRVNTPGDGMVAGIGLINAEAFGADKASCVALAYDYTVLAGTQGYFNHKKTDRMLEMAEHWKLPVVFYVEGGGGRPGDVDGGALIASSLDTTSFTAFARLSGKVPRISIVAGRCFAGNAVFLGCADITIGVRGANIGLGGPAMIEGGGLGVFTPDEIGPAEEQYALGVLDLLVDSEAEATRLARQLVGYFQGQIAPGPAADPRLLRRLIPEDRLRVYDMRQVITALADEDSFIELRGGYGGGMITGFVRIEGRAFGLIANDPRHLGGAIDSEGAEKGARFLQLCDAFDIPILSLCDTPGFMVGPASERTAAVRRGSRLFVSAATLGVPHFTIVVRKAYGLGAQAMAGGDLTASATVASWPTGEFGPMGLEGAVRLGYRKELEAEQDPVAREALFRKLVDHMYAKGKAECVAEVLEIDAVIDPAETRQWLVRSLRAARTHRDPDKPRRAFVDVW
jgi:acetyl-CoA carboxylase carboxyltransferase component/acetyl/propionyl-CoA carboxylase alpha subunit